MTKDKVKVMQLLDEVHWLRLKVILPESELDGYKQMDDVRSQDVFNFPYRGKRAIAVKVRRKEQQ